MLNTVAEQMRNCFTSKRQYRIGGDEFVVICEDMVFSDVVLQLREFKQRIKVHQIHVATGMEWRDENLDIEDMIKAADTKMYQDKEKFYQMYPEGRNGALIYERVVEQCSIIYNKLRIPHSRLCGWGFSFIKKTKLCDKMQKYC